MGPATGAIPVKICLLLILPILMASSSLAEDAPKPAISPCVVAYVPPTAEEALAQGILAGADVVARAAIEQAKERLRAYQDGIVPEGEPKDQAGKTMQERFEIARSAMQDLHMAHVDRYEQFLKAYPHNWYVRHRYAEFLADQNFTSEAAAEWRKVIEMEHRFPYAHNSLGTIYNHMGRDLEALILYRKAIELKDDEAIFHVNLATGYFTHRYQAMEEFGWDLPQTFRECLDSYKRAIALEPKNRDLVFDYATTFIMAKHFQVENLADESIEAWRYYLTLEMSDYQRGVALRNLGGIYMRQKNDPATAAELFRKADVLMRDDATVKTLLSEAEKLMKENAQTETPKERDGDQQ